MLPNRVAVYATVLAGLITAIVPVAIDADWKSTAGIIAGLSAVVIAAVTFLVGWQKHEERTATAAADDPTFPVVEDEAQSTIVVP